MSNGQDAYGQRAGRGETQERYSIAGDPEGEAAAPWYERAAMGVGEWVSENVLGVDVGPRTQEEYFAATSGAPGFEPYRVEMAKDYYDAAERLLGRIPTAEDLVTLERMGIAGQMSQAHQNLVSNAAQRGLIHSGILRAQQQKLTGQGIGQLQAATAKAQAFPEQARAKILSAMASGKPLPEVVYEVQPSGILPTLFGLGGGAVGGYAGGPGGAQAGYGLGRGAGTLVEGGPTYESAGRPTSRFR
jgi:hypothetical protein|tara:strand:+ start:17144 stop:17878 length:735 start_codon:yes stop_codon:yes gene_type:complete